MNIEEFAKSNGLDLGALNDLIGFLMRNINRNEQNREIFMRNPEEVIRQGVTAWKEMGEQFFQEMLENKTERAQQYRKEIASSVWKNANQL